MRLFRSWLCAILVLAMMFGSVPVTAFAEETAVPEGSVAEEQTQTTAETAEETEPETAEETVPEPTGETEPEVTEAPEMQEKGEVVHIPFQLNPLYEGIYTADDFPASYPDELYQGELYAATTYLTVAKAGEAVRKAMKNRQESITVHFKTDTSNQQKACEAVLAEAMKHTGNGLEGDYLAWQYAGWSATVIPRYNSNTSMYEYSGTLRISYYTTAQQEAELTTAINKLKTSLKLSSKSNYDKIFAVYDYMCQNITYDYANLNDSSYKLKHTAYAALVNKTAVCQGYALLFYRIMLELGIDCRLIPGMTEGGAHGWNIVKLNGLYYNVDATWDAGYDEYIWFLNSFWDFGGHERDMEYDTIAFHNKYPIAAESYEKGVTGTKDPYIYAGYAGAETTNVVWYLGRDGSITFKGEGDMYDFNSRDQQPYYGYWEDEITKVVVEEGITSLGKYSFYKFSALEEAVIPSGVIEIGNNCFYGCEKLKNVDLPTTMRRIGNSAFSDCHEIDSLIIPEGLEVIEDYAFDGCNSLANVEFGSASVHLGMYAFQDCDSLTEVRLHEGITLDSKCFHYCDNIKRVWIDCATVSNSAFRDCTTLTEIVLTDRVTTIEVSAFGNCDALTEVVIPESVTSLSGFSNCDNLVSVTLSENLTEIGDSCFSGSKKLETIDLPDGLQTIGSNAFASSGITKIELPKNVTINSNAFYNCGNLTEIRIHAGVTLTSECFYNCKNLKKVWIDCAVIPREAFRECTSLSELTLTNHVTTIESEAFRACYGLTELVIPESITTLRGFESCIGLISVTLPENIKEIGSNCFQGCSGLEKINLPEGLTTIGNSAFKGAGLTQIDIPESVTTINDHAFSGCKSLTEVVIPTSITSLSSFVFYNCTGLKSVDLNNVVSIEAYVFYGCVKLSSIEFPEGLTKIGSAAFQDCTSLIHVTIPQSVTYMGGFPGCVNLETVVLNNSGVVKGYAFSGCKKLKSVIVGENITGINVLAFTGCTALTEIIFEGNAPAIDSSAFEDVTATAHYPMNASWTEDKLQNYGGNITWVGYSVCTEHEYSPVVTPPPCTEQGFTTYTCTICGESYVGDEVEATGHSYEATVTEPTCNKRGFTTYTCSVCGDSYADDYVDALGHKFEDEICTVCGSPERIPGDIDGNEIVDVDDVLALLWHVLFPDDYPIEAEADFDGNETVDVDDVLALLWHVLFPEEYPI